MLTTYLVFIRMGRKIRRSVARLRAGLIQHRLDVIMLGNAHEAVDDAVIVAPDDERRK